MSEKFTHYNILVSCPSDMDAERKIIQQAAERINETVAGFRKVHFDVKFWSKDVLFSYGTPQQTINKSIVYTSDLIIALFGTKLGTPTEKYDSGTIEEIEKMIEMNKQVFVCFSEKDVILQGDANIDVLQDMLKVKQFKHTYNGLYITYKNDNELIEKIEQQLRLYLNQIVSNEEQDTVCEIPFTYQELQGIIEGISRAKEVIFCARTGKIFLAAHYNHLKEMLDNGGRFIYMTSENFNVEGESLEFRTNQKNSYSIVKNLHSIAPEFVRCFNLNKPVNNTILYIRMEDGEMIDVKFNFQTRMKERHPMFRIHSDNPYFKIFYTELTGLMGMAEVINFI